MSMFHPLWFCIKICIFFFLEKKNLRLLWNICAVHFCKWYLLWNHNWIRVGDVGGVGWGGCKLLWCHFNRLSLIWCRGLLHEVWLINQKTVLYFVKMCWWRLTAKSALIKSEFLRTGIHGIAQILQWRICW